MATNSILTTLIIMSQLVSKAKYPSIQTWWTDYIRISYKLKVLPDCYWQYWV